MDVVEDMDVHERRQSAAEPEPSWEDAAAMWDAAEPADLKRPPRKIIVVYRYVDGKFHATSASLKGFEVSGPSLYETKQLVREALNDYLDPAVELDERMPAQGSETSGVSRQTVQTKGFLLLPTPTTGRVRTFFSPSALRAKT